MRTTWLTNLPDPALWSISALLALGTLALVWWTFFADRSRGRARCPRCWYDLSSFLIEHDAGQPFTPRPCPECGRKIRTRTDLHRTRRRWLFVVPIVTLVLASALFALTPYAKRDGWLAIMPTGALITAQSYLPDAWADDVRITLLDRLETTQLSDSQRRDIVALNLSSYVQLPEAWPADIPLNILFTPGYPGGITDHNQIEFSPTLRVAQAFMTTKRTSRTASPFESADTYSVYPGMALPDWAKGSPTPGSKVPIEIKAAGRVIPFETTNPRMTASSSSWSVQLTRPVRVVASIDDLLAPVTGTDADMMALSMIRPRIVRSHFSSSVGILIGQGARPDEMRTTAVGFKLEILHNDEVVAGLRTHLSRTIDFNPVQLEAPSANLTRIFSAREDDPNWTVRITSDPEMALRMLGERTRYWKGTVVMPLKHLFNPPKTPIIGPDPLDNLPIPEPDAPIEDLIPKGA